MNRKAFLHVLAALLGCCLVARCVAGPIARDDTPSVAVVPTPDSMHLTPAGPSSEFGAASMGMGRDGQERVQALPDPAELVQAPDPGGARSEVPSADPLPTGDAVAQARPTRPEGSGTPPRPQPGRAGGASGSQAQPRTGQRADDHPQEIEFDNQGLITLHTNELDVRQLLELISRRSGMNILVSPKVQGNITANFERIAPQELVKSVLKLANLVEKVEGDVHFIYSRDEIRDESENKKKERILTKVYRLNYVRADELMIMITPFLSPEVGRKRFSTSANYLYGISEASTLSSGGMTAGGAPPGGAGGAGGAAAGGNAGTIQRGTQPPTGGFSMSNNDMVVIQDYESNLKIIDQIIQRIDIRPVQVLIEAVIISVELAKDKELGVNFALVDNLGQELGVIGSGAALNANVGFTPAQVLTAAGKIAASNPVDPTGFAGATNGIKYGFVSNNVTGFIRAIETLGSTKVLASPRILVLNKQRAEIQLGSQLGFRTLSQNYTSTIQQVQFLNTGTLLRIRPFVSTDGMVRMEIHPERSSGVVQDDLPSARTAQLSTNVMVPDGATLVIGGLMEDEDTYTQQGLPGLSRVPLLGHVFGFKQKSDTRRELVVLLTPHVWSENDPQEMSPELAMRNAPRPSQELQRASADVAGRGRPQAPTGSLFGGRFSSGLRTRRDPKPFPGAPATAGPRPTPPVPESLTLPPAEAAPDAVPPGPAPAIVAPRSQPVQPAAGPTPIKPSTMPSPEEESSARPDLKVRRASLQVEFQPVELHRVAEGESLQSIARRYYGSSRFAPALWEANRATVGSAGGLEPGTDLTIPARDELDPSMVRVIQASARSGPEAAHAAGEDVRPRPALGRTGIATVTPTASAAREVGPAARPVLQSSRAMSPGVKYDPSQFLADVIEFQPETDLGDVIEAGPSLVEDPRPATARPKIDPMLTRASLAPSTIVARAQSPTDTAVGATEGVAPAGVPSGSATASGPAAPGFAIPDLEPAPARLDGTSEAPPAQAASGRAADHRGTGAMPPDRPSPSPRQMASPSPDPPTDLTSDEGGFAVHVVRPRETIPDIARERLGDARRAGEIVELNREMLPDDLRPRPGMRLVLPARSRPPSASR